jgi:hypothetical protein
MGFTFSHPALILSSRHLPRHFYSFTGLFAGSIVPDFGYFIYLNNRHAIGHSWKGLFWFDIPVALLISLLYHQLIRNALLRNLPTYFRVRLARFQDLDWPSYLKKNWWIVLYSIIAGILTHFLWDSFTSINGYFVEHLSFFTVQYSVFGFSFLGYKVVKHVSSLIGALVLLHHMDHLKTTPPKEEDSDKYFWVFFTAVLILTLITLLLLGPAHPSLNRFVKTVITSGLVALLGASLRYRKREKRIHASN